jgi:hypothetical protein
LLQYCGLLHLKTPNDAYNTSFKNICFREDEVSGLEKIVIEDRFANQVLEALAKLSFKQL